MRGAIDLVEQHGAAGWLRVTDHKTGKNRTTRGLVVGGGSTLQPIIYTLVAEQMLGLPVHASRLSFCTTAGGFSEHPVSVRDEYRRFGVEVLEIIDRAVEHGALPQAPRTGACGWCDFKAVCGPHEERRAAHKRPDLPALEDLQALRGLPRACSPTRSSASGSATRSTRPSPSKPRPAPARPRCSSIASSTCWRRGGPPSIGSWR
jgi:hypothetical protein